MRLCKRSLRSDIHGRLRIYRSTQASRAVKRYSSSASTVDIISARSDTASLHCLHTVKEGHIH